MKVRSLASLSVAFSCQGRTERICLSVSRVSVLPSWWWRISRSSRDRKSTRLNSSHANISYAVFCFEHQPPVTADAERPPVELLGEAHLRGEGRGREERIRGVGLNDPGAARVVDARA